jgi:hypothetical protein
MTDVPNRNFEGSLWLVNMDFAAFKQAYKQGRIKHNADNAKCLVITRKRENRFSKDRNIL